MIIVYPADAKDLLGPEKYTQSLALMPSFLQARISAYESPEDRAARLAGKLLLRKILGDAGYNADEMLQQLSYAPNGKPNIPGLPNPFNITHSGTRIFVVWGDSGSAGIDAELIKPIATAVFRDYFQEAEWAWMQSASSPEQAFYHLWTRKEAVLKAIGAGIDYPLSDLNVLSDNVCACGQQWYLHTIPYSGSLSVHVAIDADDRICQLSAAVSLF